MKLSKKEFITHLKQDVVFYNFNQREMEVALAAVSRIITNAIISGDTIELPDIGRFDVVAKPARTARNPITGEPIQVPAKRAPRFKACKTLKDRVNAQA